MVNVHCESKLYKFNIIEKLVVYYGSKALLVGAHKLEP